MIRRNTKHILGLFIVMMLTVGLAIGCGSNEVQSGTENQDTELECRSHQTECDDQCVDTQTDGANCGSCGENCADGEVCFEGGCAIACPQGQSECNGGCFDITTANQHCGECGESCAAGELCSEGICENSCGDSLTECGGACRDTQSDKNHCGECGESCGSGEACVEGSCTVSCPGIQEVCGGACYDLESSPLHCGSCATSCELGEVCNSGTCALTCGDGLTECGGACRDYESDPNNCGECGETCNAGEVCSEGGCQATCGTGLSECDGGCYDLSNDPENCETCGNSCDSAPNAVGVCAAASCALVCEANFSNCDGDASTGCETPGSCANRYRRSTGIENPNSEELIDFQVRAVFDSATAIGANKMRPDCADLRFFEEDQITAVDHWLEEGCGTTETVVWLRIPILAADSTETIYMRYGDNSAESLSNGHSVFDLFDDFSTDTEEDYTLQADSGSTGGIFFWHPDEAVLRTDTSNGDFYLTHDDSGVFDEDFWVEVSAFSRDNDGLGSTLRTTEDEFWTCQTSRDYNAVNQSGDDLLLRHFGVPAAQYVGDPVLNFGNINHPQNNWTISSTAYDGTHLHCAFDYARRGETFNVGSMGIESLGLGTFANNPAADYRWWRVRKFATNPPEVSVQSEEALY